MTPLLASVVPLEILGNASWRETPREAPEFALLVQAVRRGFLGAVREHLDPQARVSPGPPPGVSVQARGQEFTLAFPEVTWVNGWNPQGIPPHLRLLWRGGEGSSLVNPRLSPGNHALVAGTLARAGKSHPLMAKAWPEALWTPDPWDGGW